MSETNKTLLIVDAPRAGATMLARMLEQDGYRAHVVFDALRAWTWLAEQPAPLALITNLVLPKPVDLALPLSEEVPADGFALARRALTLIPSLPVIFITERPEVLGDAHHGLSPAMWVLPKPVDYATLLERLGRLSGETAPPAIMGGRDGHAA